MNVDMCESVKADVHFNLEDSWPLGDDKYDHILASHVIEHMHDLDHFMCEAYRVLVPDGTMLVTAPYWNHETAWCDPGHVRAITEIFPMFYSKSGIQYNLDIDSCMTPQDLKVDFAIVKTTFLLDERASWLKEMEPGEQSWHLRHSCNIISQIQFELMAKK